MVAALALDTDAVEEVAATAARGAALVARGGQDDAPRTAAGPDDALVEAHGRWVGCVALKSCKSQLEVSCGSLGGQWWYGPDAGPKSACLSLLVAVGSLLLEGVECQDPGFGGGCRNPS